VNLGLERRVAVVTGSTRGIGRAAAEAFAREGALVAVTYCHDEERADAVAAAICAGGGEAMTAFLDLGSHASILEAIDRILARYGRIDVLVNNAVRWSEHRVAEAPPFERLPPEQWRDLLRSNIEGVYATIQAALPSMRERRWGRIVNVSAVLAADGMRGAAWYATAKAALHGLTRSLAKEVGIDGILANVVMPGLTITEHTLEVIPAQVMDENRQGSPLGRLLLPGDIASTVVYLASAANTAITGEVIRASGGAITPHRPARQAHRLDDEQPVAGIGAEPELAKR